MESIFMMTLGGPGRVGGEEMVTYRLMKGILERGYRVVNYFPDTGLDRFGPLDQLDKGILVRSVRNSTLPYVRRLTGSGSLSWVKELKAERPTRVIVNNFEECFPFGLVAGGLLPKTRIVQIFHGEIGGLRRKEGCVRETITNILRPVKWGMYGEFLKSYKVRCISVSETVRNAAKRCLGVDSEVCYPPTRMPRVDDRSFDNKRPGNILTVSRVSPEKGLELLGDVARRSKEMGAGYVFRLVGKADKGDYGNKMSQYLKDVESVGCVVGDKLDDCYRKAGVGFQPSMAEGFGLAYIESLASGNPTIGFSKAFKEILTKIGHPVGLWLDPRSDNVVGKVVEFLQGLESNVSLYQEMSRNSLRVRQIFDPDLLTNQMIDAILK